MLKLGGTFAECVTLPLEKSDTPLRYSKSLQRYTEELQLGRNKFNRIV